MLSRADAAQDRVPADGATGLFCLPDDDVLRQRVTIYDMMTAAMPPLRRLR